MWGFLGKYHCIFASLSSVMDTAQEVGLFGCTEWLTIPLNEDSAKNIFSFRDLSQRNQVNPSQAQVRE